MAAKPASIIEHPLDETLESIERRVLSSLRPMYESQRLALLHSINAALASPGHVNWIALGCDLHAIAGIAGHFDENDLGNLARNAEISIRLDAARADQLLALRNVREEIERAN